jgi:predicted metal-dependent peptidase
MSAIDPMDPRPSEELENKAALAITKARTVLILKHPFFGALIMRLKIRPDWTHPTAATDGREIRYNPGFIAPLTQPRLLGVLAHELLHCTFKHQERRGNRDPLRWNLAGDLAINPLIRDASNELELPDGALDDPDFYGMSAEEIYAKIKLPKPPDSTPGDGKGKGEKSPKKRSRKRQEARTPANPPEDEDPNGDGPPEEEDENADNGRKTVIPPTEENALGDVEDDPGPDPDDPDADPTPWESSALSARHNAKGRGDMPAALDEALTRSIKPTYSLTDLIREFIAESAKSDYTWSRPNRNYRAHGKYLPSLAVPEPTSIAVFIDVSGSINPAQVQTALDAVQGAAEELALPCIVCTCNDAVQFYKRFEPWEKIKIPGRPGGGTDFRPPFDRLAAENERPAAALYLSADLDGTFPAPTDAPDYPVLWISEPLYEPPAIPFGVHHAALERPR